MLVTIVLGEFHCIVIWKLFHFTGNEQKAPVIEKYYNLT